MVHQMPKHSPVLVWNVPDEIKKAFKLACVKRNLPMRKVIIEFMKQYGEMNARPQKTM